MGATHFSGPVVSGAGFVVGSADDTSGVYGGGGTSADPISLGTTADQKMYANYATVAATTGDTRLVYDKLTFTGAGGSGETLRAFSVVSGAVAATGGTVNGAHISLEINGTGGGVSGAGRPHPTSSTAPIVISRCFISLQLSILHSFCPRVCGGV